MTNHKQPDACGCLTCGDMLREGLARRGFLRFATAGAAGLALGSLARPVFAAGPSGYRAMLLTCVDPRTQAPIFDWMSKPAVNSHAISMTGLYSQFTIAGAAVAVTAPKFEAWRQTFWDNLGASVQLHGITSLIAVDHGNCGALGIAYGPDALKDPKREFELHKETATMLKQELGGRIPGLNLQVWYVDRDKQGAFTEWTNLYKGPVIE